MASKRENNYREIGARYDEEHCVLKTYLFFLACSNFADYIVDRNFPEEATTASLAMRARGAAALGPEDDDIMIAAALTHSADIMQQQEVYAVELKKGASLQLCYVVSFEYSDAQDSTYIFIIVYFPATARHKVSRIYYASRTHSQRT